MLKETSVGKKRHRIGQQPLSEREQLEAQLLDHFRGLLLVDEFRVHLRHTQQEIAQSAQHHRKLLGKLAHLAHQHRDQHQDDAEQHCDEQNENDHDRHQSRHSEAHEGRNHRLQEVGKNDAGDHRRKDASGQHDHRQGGQQHNRKDDHLRVREVLAKPRFDQVHVRLSAQREARVVAFLVIRGSRHF